MFCFNFNGRYKFKLEENIRVVEETAFLIRSERERDICYARREQNTTLIHRYIDGLGV